MSGHVSIEFGLRGPSLAISTACASGTNAIGEAFRKIQNNEMDIAFSGGVEAPLTAVTFAGYCALKVLSKRNDSPQEASRPFDRDRDGFVMSEGAGILILESLTHALKHRIIVAQSRGLDLRSDIHPAIEAITGQPDHHQTEQCPTGCLQSHGFTSIYALKRCCSGRAEKISPRVRLAPVRTDDG